MAVLTQKTLQQWKQDRFTEQRGICPICGKTLESWQKANADHDHRSGCMRALVCPGCNIFEGRIQTLLYRAGLAGADWAAVLRNLADYWRADYSENPIHPSFINDESKKFGKPSKSREKMIKELRAEGIDVDKTYTREQLVQIFKDEYRKRLA
ncbi:endonuclease domain-containing protein [Citrobacter sp. Cpo114]|uniref:endonuclease domain-containing protein n=1 Tax=Citrobacter sp. Cpo114 TaxID=2985147 RepID=UPI0025822A2D|nr:endonuclease domain-containing protein [Citrobacter sp. Cpo114]MDM2792504.1 endonuclease domain-containing protein [Citrobacter sp. Cpo114]